MIESPGTRRVRRTPSREPRGHPAHAWLPTAGLAIAIVLAPASTLAVVATAPAVAQAAPMPAAAPAPTRATPAPPAAGAAPTRPPPAAPRSRANDAPLVSISTPPPAFPDHARRARLSGYVVVQYTIGTDGRVGNVRVVESSPPGVFDRAVQTALARWRYEPLANAREVTHTFDFDQ